MRLDTLRWAGGSYRANATLGAVAPFAVTATISANLDTPPVPGTATRLPVAVTAQLDGPLTDMQAQAQVRSSAAGMEATHATATARITPWAAQPVPEAQADMSGLDVRAIWPQAPQTQLTGHVRVAPSGTATWQVDADVRNDLAGPWDEHRLPVAQLKTSGEWRAGMALVRELDAQLGGGRMQASGQWQPGAAGWTLHGKVTGVDPAALHTQLAAAPVSGRLDARQDGAAIAFDVALQGSGKARKPAKASARTHKAAPIELRELLARGSWSNGHLSLPTLTARTADASLRGALEVAVATRAGSGRLDLQAPGLRGSAQGQLSETQGHGTLRVEGGDLALAEQWLRRLPGLDVVVKAPDIGGRATASLAWQGGWRDPAIQARVTSSALELRTGDDPRAAPTWAVTDLIALIDGRLSDAGLVLQAHAKRGQRQVGLQLAGRGGSTPLRAGAAARWRGHVTKLALDVQDPAVSAGAWTLVAQRPIDVQWSSADRALDVTAGQAKLSAPAIRGTASASQATLSWDPVRWRAGELRTAGRISGLAARLAGTGGRPAARGLRAVRQHGVRRPMGCEPGPHRAPECVAGAHGGRRDGAGRNRGRRVVAGGGRRARGPPDADERRQRHRARAALEQRARGHGRGPHRHAPFAPARTAGNGRTARRCRARCARSCRASACGRCSRRRAGACAARSPPTSRSAARAPPRSWRAPSPPTTWRCARWSTASSCATAGCARGSKASAWC